MDKDLEFYIKTYKLLDQESCRSIIKDIEHEGWQQHEYNSQKIGYHTLNGDRELDVHYTENCGEKYYVKIVMEKIWDAYLNYIEDLKFPWYNGWNGYSQVRFNRYKETTLMSEHCDHIHTIFDGERKGVPTMSALGLLNDDYKGGELVFFGDKVMPFSAGEIMIFPSCFLYPHLVKPVTQGIRYSFVSWAW